MMDDLKGYQWLQEEIMLLWEDQMIISIITWISFADEVKYFS